MWSRPVLWYGVCPDAIVRLVVVRDPTGAEPDDFFFTTDLATAPGEVVSVQLRRTLLHERNTPGSQPAAVTPEMPTVLVETLATAT